jgi:hypothetical protein
MLVRVADFVFEIRFGSFRLLARRAERGAFTSTSTSMSPGNQH